MTTPARLVLVLGLCFSVSAFAQHKQTTGGDIGAGGVRTDFGPFPMPTPGAPTDIVCQSIAGLDNGSTIKITDNAIECRSSTPMSAAECTRIQGRVMTVTSGQKYCVGSMYSKFLTKEAAARVKTIAGKNPFPSRIKYRREIQ